jgi:hypothetical protein
MWHRTPCRTLLHAWTLGKHEGAKTNNAVVRLVTSRGGAQTYPRRGEDKITYSDFHFVLHNTSQTVFG